MQSIPLHELVPFFLLDLRNANRSPHTVVNYASDLNRFARGVGEETLLDELTLPRLQRYLSTLSGKAPTTRARHQASLRALLKWCHQNGHIERDLGALLPGVTVPQPYPRGIDDSIIARVLAGIPEGNLRDRLLFTLIAETGLRAGEALGIRREDISLNAGDERIMVRGKGQTTRTIALYAAPTALPLLRRYLEETAWLGGPLFRGGKGENRASALTYRSAHSAWRKHCDRFGVRADIHALRHSYATSLVNSGVRLEIVRKLLGHKSMQTTLRYAEINDATVKAELRAQLQPRF